MSETDEELEDIEIELPLHLCPVTFHFHRFKNGVCEDCQEKEP